MERLAAAAAFFLVRVLEFESSIETFTDKVQFGSVDIGQALGINNYFDPVAFVHLTSGSILSANSKRKPYRSSRWF